MASENKPLAVSSMSVSPNAKVPACGLPAEILSSIFKYCLPLPAAGARKVVLRSRSQTLAWLTLTRVCRYWRTVALNHPWMWTFPDFSFPEFAREMLKRSKSTPLDIHYFESRYMSPSSTEALLEALGHATRLASVHLSMGTDVDKAMAKLVEPAPVLHSLIVISYVNYTLPANFLGGSAPLLTSVELHRCYLPWNSPVLKCLTILSLKGDGSTNQPTPQQFRHAIQQMPSLEVLELENIFPTNKAEDPPILLPNLQRLHLAARNRFECAFVLTYISLPSTTNIHIDCRMQTSQYMSPLLSNIPRIFLPISESTAETRVLRSLMINGDSDHSEVHLLVKAWSQDEIPFDATDEKSKSTPIPNLQLSLKWVEGPRFCIVNKALLQTLPLTSLQTLHIALYPRAGYSWSPAPEIKMERLEMDIWPKTLTTLVVRGEYTTDELNLALKRWGIVGVDAPIGSHIMAFPSVQCLVLSNVNFDTYDSCPLLPSLVSALRTRLIQLPVIQKLVLKQCTGYTKTDIEMLEKVVNDVEG
ncbi:hypothetical protein Moror_9390 [Moniliophthora roreri MCA 2997]|uniref:F-box domain-containing protein n=1 Tax=Moniliophthora roreri (strain MCA 2997) TaxID=1381753 RepID=V2Y335_MONRO|nr:hypothetical protein Moror_9390 [Moniliophthora roreri MCA 2997]